MTHRMGMSQVKFRVRHNALLLREFSVADMVRATGLNPESVRTELQRMKRESLLTAQPHPVKSGKRGAPPALYRLTDDPETRLSLSKSLEAFYPSLQSTDRPTSHHYALACQAIDEAMMADADNPRRNELLAQAEDDLDMAEQAEGSSLASDSVRAYLRYEKTCLAYLRGKHDKEIVDSFQALYEFFTDMQDRAMVKCIGEYLIYLEFEQRIDKKTITIFDDVPPIFRARCLLNIVYEKSYQTDSPLISGILKLLRQLSETLEKETVAVAFNRQSMETTDRLDRVEEDLKTLQGKYSLSSDMPYQDKSQPLEKLEVEKYRGLFSQRGSKYVRH